MHLIQDASVPAHTRNDLHGLWEPFESWTAKNIDYLNTNHVFIGPGSASWGYWKQNSNINVPDVFIDADKLQDATTQPITGLNQGIAEYSHANFLSKGCGTLLDILICLFIPIREPNGYLRN